MEPRSRETTPTKEDLEFIVDDGYRHNEDPDYIPNEKIIIKGPVFKRLTRNAKKACCRKKKKIDLLFKDYLNINKNATVQLRKYYPREYYL